MLLAACALALGALIQPRCDNSLRLRIVPPAPAARLWASSARGDTALCMSAACAHSESTSGYVEGGVLGYPPPASAAAVPVAVFYSATHRDNWVGTAGVPPPDASYSRAFDNGRLLPAPRAGGGDVPVDAFWSASANRSAVGLGGATPAGGFRKVGRLGWPRSATLCS